MKIKRLVIENFKSIERIELIVPNPFTVFVGPNGSGKSNIFEALEFVNLNEKFEFSHDADRLFGGPNTFLNRIKASSVFKFECHFEKFKSTLKNDYVDNLLNPLIGPSGLADNFGLGNTDTEEYKQFYKRFCRVFVGNERLVKLPFNDNTALSLSAKNLERVLKRVLSDPILKNEIFEWLELFVPEFKSVDIVTNQFDGKDTLLWYEQYSEKPFTRDLISDGTFNILAMLTAVYQSDDKPQFLCIEEPENGLHPQVAGELVDFFRIMCEERGHYIWLNTHSASMASRVKPEELIVVEKKQGATRIKQVSKEDFKNWRMDEAWLTNALGGGLAW